MLNKQTCATEIQLILKTDLLRAYAREQEEKSRNAAQAATELGLTPPKLIWKSFCEQIPEAEHDYYRRRIGSAFVEESLVGGDI